MPSKSDIQFGKIVVANQFASKDEVEEALKLQYRFEKKRSVTAVAEPFLLHVTSLEVEQILAIQEKTKRRVIFCSDCKSKFNIAQFTGGEKFLCHKCGTRVKVPNQASYSSWLEDYLSTVEAFVREEEELDAKAPPLADLEEEDVKTEKQTVLIDRSDIEGLDEEPAVEVEELELEPEEKAPDVASRETPIELEAVKKDAPPAKKAPADKSASDVAKKILKKKKKKKKKKAEEEPAEAGAVEDLVFTLDSGVYTVTGGSEKSFLADAPKHLEDVFSGKKCSIDISGFSAATRDCIKEIRSVYKKKKSKAKVTLTLTKDQEKLAGSMTKKMFTVKTV